MKINHDVLGTITVEIGDTGNIALTLNNETFNVRTWKANDKYALKFYKEIKIKQSPKKIGGLKISKEEYVTITQEVKAKEQAKEEREYQEWLDSKASYHTSYGFGFKAEKFKKDVQDMVSKDIEDRKTDVDRGEYSITYYYDITNREVVELLKIKKEELSKVADKKEQERKAKRDAIFEKAKTTGQDQILNSYSCDCNNPNQECDIDTVIEYATPDGKVKTVRNHTW